MNIGLFGGTFDPIHRGHLALARAAMEHCKLGRILLVAANVPPHKRKEPLSAFAHRYAMVTLATMNDKGFVPSLIEAPEECGPDRAGKGDKKKDSFPKPNYTIETVRRLKQSFRKADRLFLLIGIDAFKDIAKWHKSEELFGECEFVVASRPGYSLADVANALPPKLRPREEVTRPFRTQAATGNLVLSGVRVQLMDEVHQPISSTAIRQAAAAGKPLARFVDAAVADYIKKMELYRRG
jgi:nicotinate-nucleotide adenylyltransferase